MENPYSLTLLKKRLRVIGICLPAFGSMSTGTGKSVIRSFISPLRKVYLKVANNLTRESEKKRYYIPEIENIQASDSLIGAFDVDFIEPENLLFQTGYLTIEQKQRVAGKIFYKLTYPNMEVKASLSDYILNRYSHDNVMKEKVQLKIYQAFQENDPDALNTVFQALFSAIPHDWYRKNRLSEYEGYYASIFYCYFTALGLDVTPEDTTNHGRIDMTVQLDNMEDGKAANKIYIFEFKVVDIDTTPGKALEQIKQKGYADKYRGNGCEIYLVGVEFD